MGKLRSFELVFDGDKSVYHPGEVVSGKCILDVKGDMKMRALSVQMKGTAKVHWTESRSTGTRLGNYTDHYNAQLDYFSRTQILVGNDQDDCVLVSIPDGRQEFSFSFPLPSEGIATSFEGKHGSVRYWLKAEIDKPWSLTHRIKKLFTVITQIDINKPEYRTQVENNTEKTLCCLFCRSGPVTISARTDRRGFCPGESVSISAEFENHSNRTIVPSAALYQSQTYFASGRSRTREHKFNVLTGVPVRAGATGNWDGQLLKLPAVSPTILNCCLIKVEYYVKIALKIPGAYSLDMYLPIVVGTVPFRPSSHRLRADFDISPAPLQFLQVPGMEQAMAGPPPYRETETPPPPFDEPPTYLESVLGAVLINDDEDIGNQQPFNNQGSIVTSSTTSNLASANSNTNREFLSFCPLYPYNVRPSGYGAICNSDLDTSFTLSEPPAYSPSPNL